MKITKQNLTIEDRASESELTVCIQFGKLGYLQVALTGVWWLVYGGGGVTVISLSSVRRLAAGAGAKYSLSCTAHLDAAELLNTFHGESPVVSGSPSIPLSIYNVSNSDDITDKVWAVAQLFKSLFLVSFR